MIKLGHGVTYHAHEPIKAGNVTGHRSTIDLLVRVNQSICGPGRRVEGRTGGVFLESGTPILAGDGRALFLVAVEDWRGSCFLGCDSNKIGGYYNNIG